MLTPMAGIQFEYCLEVKQGRSAATTGTSGEKNDAEDL